MKISIFGLGYVGCVLAAGLASLGHNIIGIDINSEKVEVIKKGKSPVVEKDLDKYIKKYVELKKIEATTNSKEAVLNSEMSFVCVGTPAKKDGSLDLEHTKKVCEGIGKALKLKNSYHIIVFKSTMFPGSVENLLIPIIENNSGKKASKDFGVCHNPEFLREGSAVYDFFNPSTTVIGCLDEKSERIVEELFKDIKAPIAKTSIKVAEMIKYANNSFHGLKVAFANEIGNICKKSNIDSHELMKIFCMDEKLNISSSYLKPGVPFGGSCLTKDSSALIDEAKKEGLNVPLLEAIKKSNESHIDVCANIILGTNKKKIGILGLSFKEGTDDLRSSAMIAIVKKLVDRGLNIKIYDKNVLLSQKFGANKKIIEEEFPHLMNLFCPTIRDVVNGSEAIVIKNKDDDFKILTKLIKESQIVIDFVRMFEKKEIKGEYVGLCW
ncbi:UDP-glucose/GDP-mannose dehydrogenase family protein [Candidatus Woesearchaeota archaeon]|nr:UDP-glucose/GDP-mannose dehydrogenase family protein [Candidatus Woesearchaeota archaeon]